MSDQILDKDRNNLVKRIEGMTRKERIKVRKSLASIDHLDEIGIKPDQYKSDYIKEALASKERPKDSILRRASNNVYVMVGMAALMGGGAVWVGNKMLERSKENWRYEQRIISAYDKTCDGLTMGEIRPALEELTGKDLSNLNNFIIKKIITRKYGKIMRIEPSKRCCSYSLYLPRTLSEKLIAKSGKDYCRFELKTVKAPETISPQKEETEKPSDTCTTDPIYSYFECDDGGYNLVKPGPFWKLPHGWNSMMPPDLECHKKKTEKLCNKKLVDKLISIYDCDGDGKVTTGEYTGLERDYSESYNPELKFTILEGNQELDVKIVGKVPKHHFVLSVSPETANAMINYREVCKDNKK